ncbi:hypothetical protein ASF37_11715 [Aeromicrobium sp. Leaf289]|uniref:DUF3631 domain-containing protein n=1 Tax=Aeromicrobium sp. Leaf289 TaxID=1736324 RepID=UPI0006F236DD|nr:DUF3631 domain-containing protein [Aeromicrobium sp. Leaf289]KQP77224.1 hypothetical protein ASF37_11715 [Aeromicrobium sp. Leaf289]
MSGWDAADFLQPVQPLEPVLPVQKATPLEPARAWFERYVTTVNDHDLDLLTLWAAHTHLAFETYTTPRLLIDSPVPGSGKTTVLEHLSRLCHHPVQAASLSSPALLARLLDAGMRTILIDEADRSLSPKLDGVGELLAVLNSGYKRGGARPVLVPGQGGTWDVKEMPTYSPVAMAGNSPDLPDDTKSRCIRVLLMPDIDGTADESDWELIEDDAAALGAALAGWAGSVRDEVRTSRPSLPEGIRGRLRECWGPLKRVAVAAGGRWPDVADELALKDLERIQRERDEGIVIEKPHILLLGHLHLIWPEGQSFLPTEKALRQLVDLWPESWGAQSPFGKDLTAQRLGRMLVKHFSITTSRPDANGPRGYTRASLEPAFRSLGLDKPAGLAEPAEPAAALFGGAS